MKTTNNSMINKAMNHLWLLPILLAGAFLRLYNNTAVALWHDEAFSALYIKYSWSEMLYRITLDVHPPLYYYVLRLWTYVLGHSLLSLRGMSILFGVLTIWAGYMFVKRAFKNQNLALLSALFLAINPFQIQYALEARMYTLGTFLLLLSSWLLVKALEEKRFKIWAWYGVVVAAALYTHYYLIFSILAQGIYIIYYLLKQNGLSIALIKDQATKYMLGGYAIALLLYLPWLKTFIEQKNRVQEAFWIPPMNTWSIPGTIWKMAFGGEGAEKTSLVIACLLTVFFLVYFLRKIKMGEKWLVALSLVIPFLGAIALSLQTAIYLDRYFVFASMFFSILLAIALMQVPRSSVRKTLIIILVAVSVIAFFKNWSQLDVKNVWSDRHINKKPGMARASQFINDNATPEDQIYVSSSFVFFTYKYYNDTGIKPLLYSTGTLETIPHFSGTAILTNDDLVLDFNKAPKNKTVWLVWTTGFGGSKPVTPGNWRVVQEKEYPDTPGFKGSIFVTQYHIN